MPSARTGDQIDDDQHDNPTDQPQVKDEPIDDVPLTSDDTDNVRRDVEHAQPWLDWGNS